MGLTFNKTTGLAMATLVGAVSASLLIFGVSGCGKSGSGGDVATVNGVGISKQEFDDYIIRKPSVTVMTNSGPQSAPVAETLGLQTLRDLVNRQLTIQLATEMGVAPTPADVQKEIDFRQKRSPNYLQSLTAQGIGLDLVKRDVTLELSREHIITKGITVTPEEVDQYIKDNPEKFRTPPSVKALFIVVTSPAEEKQVDSELSNGQNFQIVAERYSKAPNVRQTHAQAAETNLDKYPPVFRSALDATKEGKTTEWLPAGRDQYLKFYVEGKTAAGQVKIDDTIRELVRRQRAIDKGMKATDLNARLLAEFKRSNMNVMYEPLKNGWKSVEDALKAPADAQGGTTTKPQN